jgi:hypothetical protein
VVPTDSAARSALETFGSPISIWSPPTREISGSETPSESTRWRMISIARSMSSGVTSGTWGVGRPW